MLKSAAQAQFGYLIDQLPQSTAFFNKQRKLVYASSKWIADFDFERHDVVGKSIFQLFGKQGKTWEDSVKNCLFGKQEPSLVKRLLNDGKNEKWYEWTFKPWFDEKENITGIIIQTIDVSEQITQNHEFDKLKNLLAEQSEVADIGTWNYSAVQDELTWCNMTAKIHEVPDDFTLVPDSATSFYKQGYDRNTMSRVLEAAIQKGTPWHETLLLITHTGKEKWVITTGKPVFNNDKFVGLIGTCQDVDDKKRNEAKAKEEQKLLRTLIDNLPQHIFIKDLQSQKVLANKAEVEFCGFEHESEIIGKSDFEIFDEETAQEAKKEDLQIIKNLQPLIDKEHVNFCVKGNETSTLTSKIPLIGDDGEAFGIVGIRMDITSIKQKEAELNDLINVTSEQNKKLINFAHIVSHNLRSHSANFSMLLDFLVNEKNGDERENIITMLVEASDNLLETLENLNEVVQINTNTSLAKKPMLLRDAVVKVEQNLSAFLQNNNAKLINRISEKITVPVIPAYLESILMNLLTNGIKYKDPNRDPIIELRAMKVKDNTVLSISDNGIGIDLEKYGDKLFGMYKTFHNNPDARGIGLYISKNQIEAMQGKITVASEVGKGSTFKIYFNENS